MPSTAHLLSRFLCHRMAQGIALTLLIVLGTAGCGSNSETEQLPTANISSDAPATSSRYSEAAPLTGDLRHAVVKFATSMGDIVIRLDGEQAPATVRNFLDYVQTGFYADTVFHYVEQDQMIIGGGYTETGMEKVPRPPIQNEAHNGLKNVRGTVTMARDRSAIDSATSQFFINLADAPSLDHTGETAETYGYCVFGRVIEGLDIAEQIASQETVDRGGDLVRFPNPPVLIQAAEVVRQ